VIELARYQEGPASVVVSREGDALVFWSDYDDCGKSILSESRIAVGASFAAHRADDVADVVEILRAGGAEATDRHRELAASAGASQVEALLRR
jgi:hypothetical protein